MSCLEEVSRTVSLSALLNFHDCVRGRNRLHSTTTLLRLNAAALQVWRVLFRHIHGIHMHMALLDLAALFGPWRCAQWWYTRIFSAASPTPPSSSTCTCTHPPRPVTNLISTLSCSLYSHSLYSLSTRTSARGAVRISDPYIGGSTPAAALITT